MEERRCPVLGCRTSGDPAPIGATSYLCWPCRQRTLHTVASMPRLYVHLHRELAPGRQKLRDAPLSSLAPDSRPPLRIEVLDMMARMVDRIAHWQHTLISLRTPARPLPPVRPAIRVLQGSKALVAYGHVLLERPTGPAFADDMIGLRADARRVLNWRLLVHRLPAPCPDCNTLGLVRLDGMEQVLCSYCGACWNAEDYRRLVHVLALEAGEYGFVAAGAGIDQ